MLLKGCDDRGFVFYTNYNSRKARELAATGRASLLFYWRSLERQVRIDGRAEKVSAEESDAYFATRAARDDPRASSRRGGPRSRTRSNRDSLSRETYGERVPRPAWWGGYRIVPDEFEFWQGRPSRLHDRPGT